MRDMTTGTLIVDAYPTSTSYTVSNLAPGHTYRWNVAAINSTGTSSYTTPIYFTAPSAQVTTPATPGNPSPGSVSSPGPVLSGATATLNWSASNGATKYGLAVRDMATGTLIVDAYPTSTSYTVSNLTPGHTYRWNVAAINSTGTSAYTTPLYFQALATSAPTVTVTAPNGGESLARGVAQTIGWSVSGDTSQVASFLVSYSSDGGATYLNDVGSATGTSRSISWTPPLVISASATGKVRIQARNAANTVLSQDVSDATFSYGAASGTSMKFDRDTFFTRHQANFGTFTIDPVAQRAALDTLLGYIESDPALPLDPNLKSLRWAAYMLATTREETKFTYRPVEEDGLGAGRPYGQPDPVTGLTYYGRGYVQLTFKDNYLRLGNALGVDLVDHPELALDPPTAYKVMSYGMRNGSFTSYKLGDFITDTSSDYVNARKIVNGLDQADSIADAAVKFEAELKAALGSSSTVPAVAAPVISPEGGTYTDGQQATVTLTSATEGATIYYTTDGSTPTASSHPYNTPVIVVGSMTLQAIALRAGYADSGISSAVFTFQEAVHTSTLSVTLSPAEAVNAGAQWQVDDGEWQNSGDAAEGLSDGNHLVSFKAIDGWSAPASQMVSQSAGQSNSVSGIYTRNATRVMALIGDLSFGNVVGGNQSATSFSIANRGNAPLTVTGISYPAYFTGNWNGGVIPAGGSQDVLVIFGPAPAGSYSGTITISSDKTEGPNTIQTSGAFPQWVIPAVVTSSGRAGTMKIGNLSYFTYRYLRLAGDSDIGYTVGVSDDLVTWDWTENQVTPVGSPTPSGDGITEEVIVRLKTPLTTGPARKFLELRITTP
jgi:hypothetical protein